MRWVLLGSATLCVVGCVAAFAAGEPVAVPTSSGWPDPGTFTGPGAVALMWLHLREQVRDLRAEIRSLRQEHEDRGERLARIEQDARTIQRACRMCEAQRQAETN